MKRIDIDSLGNPGACYNKLISEFAPTGKIISLGDSARSHAILNMPYFINNKDKIDSQGINLDKSHCGTYKHFTINHGNANNMPQFKDEEFDCVISVMMLEHNPEFWLALNEMKRILKKNGLLIIIIPGYHTSTHINNKLIKPYSQDPQPWGIIYGCHGDPDCYRFSPHFFKYVVFKNFKNYKLYDVLYPSRLCGFGYK